jgi:peptidoglycan/xylan/chitin deacetylase (PgdA/CDA1 family)
MADDFSASPAFGGSATDGLASSLASFDELPGQGPVSILSGKLSRVLARNVRTRTARMRNATPLVTFSFDDVLASACTTGARVLEQGGARGTYFVSAGGLGVVGPCGQIASEQQIRDLVRRGHEIGCHTYSHLAVSRVSRRRLEHDLILNRKALESFGVAARNFCYPYGDLSFAAKLFLQDRFDSCRSAISGVNHGDLDLGAIKSCELFDERLDRPGVEKLVAHTVRTNGWLVFYSHDVDPSPSPCGVTPDFLRFALETATAAGCRCVTIADGLSRAAGHDLDGSVR